MNTMDLQFTEAEKLKANELPIIYNVISLAFYALGLFVILNLGKVSLGIIINICIVLGIHIVSVLLEAQNSSAKKIIRIFNVLVVLPAVLAIMTKIVL